MLSEVFKSDSLDGEGNVVGQNAEAIMNVSLDVNGASLGVEAIDNALL